MSSSTQTLHFLSLLSLLSLFSPAHSTTNTTTDFQLLLNLKTALQTPTTATFFSSWQLTNPPCNFTGVICDATNQITQLDLSNQRLTGISLPFHSICQLKSLQTLSLGHNQLHGPITDHLRNCINLRYLDLGSNFFSGPFPDVSPLNKLTHLYLNNSGLSGAFPWASLRNMTGLVVLSLGDNQLDRTPFPAEVVELVRLNWLYLSNCSIEGRIPKGIGNLTELVNLELSRNYLTGEIPVEISKLKKLWQLELYYNSFTGRFPVGFGNLTNLENFDASKNYLEGDLLELRTLNNLVSLQLYENGFSGEIPAEFGEFGKLVNLSLYENKLTGTIPQALGSKSEFIFIDASENFLSGPIPPDMCKQGKMIKLLLLQNNLTGDIPVSYANCLSLIRLRVSDNWLSGVVPSGIWGLPQVGLIDLAMNQFEGSITSDIGNAKALSQLIVGNNKLSGELPLEIAKATALIEIDLSDNGFSGKIPSPICELKLLSRLNLQKNMFSGPIPETIGNCVALNDINMAVNSLSGGIPASLGSLPSLNSLNLSENELSGQIPATLSSLKLSLLDLSNNRLIGPIPSSVSLEAYNGSFAGNNGLCSQNIKFFRRCSSNPSGSQSFWLITLGVAVGAIMLLLLLIPFVLYLKKGSHKDEERSLKEDSWDLKSFHILSFTEDEILDSIKQENLIGKGGSGKVYKVLLPNGTELAVKHIWNSDSGGRKMTKRVGKSKEFEAEVETLSSIRHVNVVKLYCSIMSEDSSLLVYEYLPNGSLWDRLHMCGKMVLDWETRYEIAVGAAKGLEYLHHGLERPLIHRDVKSSNILLDEFYKPRIADFGLAKIVKGNKSKDSTHVIVGTHGYIAPEYGYTYKVNEKSDIYSFGVVLMELVTGRRPIEPEYGDNQDIVNWVSTKLTKEAALSIVDSNIRDVHREEAIKVLRIAILCTTRLPNMRPTMRSVVQMLEEAEPCKFISIIISKVGRSKKEELKDSNCGAQSENETNPSQGVSGKFCSENMEDFVCCLNQIS